ncbi:Undecaprenyl-phosphate 4-deoxy-4-formamido-L-arabinose transferase [Planctomycetes bacterium CA13]|uniref:Undecaprenyl-phosphate 4-deoxy-4-formamido-L-arabinose transferase n=1 Tax=Novipirellula herctigrandis TaxID=2527986 RepID=A0A5C5ZAH6_9BACT|nr:Undecaprenyl-phosphate 4-deoxy-4-formamido-L-arabinose transferase [Planctomycetes bacterium CA13]
MKESPPPEISIVIPVYRSASILPETLAQLDAFFHAHPMKFEIVLVNDGSPDDSWEVLKQLKQGRDEIIIVDLIRNFGQHSAMMCGLKLSRGKFVVTMDDDLQNPPSEIIHLIDKINEGHDVVFGRFQQKQHGLIRRVGSKIVGWLNRKLFNKPRDLTLTNFRIIRRDIVDAVCKFRTNAPYLPGLLLMTGKSFANVDVVHHPRFEGESNYTVLVIAKLIWRLVFNYSAFPLRLLCGFGLLISLFAFLFGCYVIIKHFTFGIEQPGWTTLVVLISFFQGVTLVVLSAMGEYLVRILNDVSGPRAYLIRQVL